jgi:hypothetical protein
MLIARVIGIGVAVREARWLMSIAVAAALNKTFSSVVTVAAHSGPNVGTRSPRIESVAVHGKKKRGIQTADAPIPKFSDTILGRPRCLV